MFYQNLIRLCTERGTTPTEVCHSIGLAGSAATKWKSGAIPRDTTLQKIADYFETSTSYLLGLTDEPNVVLSEQVINNLAESIQNIVDDLDKQKKPVLGLNPKLSAMIDKMDQEELEELERYAEFVLSKKKG